MSAKPPLKIAAIIMARNAAQTLDRVLSHLQDNQIEGYLVDHGSTDSTPDTLVKHAGNPIVATRFAPFSGVFDLTAQLEIKKALLAEINADWIIHLDADEILESPREHESLRGFIERVDATDANVIDCREYVFTPASEEERFEGSDFVSAMRYYYFFDPPGRTLHRIFRRTLPVDSWAITGGHAVSDSVVVSPERARMRHYPGLSLDHLRAQYLPRVFSARDVGKNWHGNRFPTSSEFISLPPTDRLRHVDRDGWIVDEGESTHLIFSASEPSPGSRFRALGDFTPLSAEPPAPFIVGVGRSGTTLLRMMLDAHSQLAIPPETHWLPVLIGQLNEPNVTISSISAALRQAHNWQDMKIGEDVLAKLLEDFGVGECAVESASPSRTSGVIRAVFRSYAARFGKTRFGDKTPLHNLNLDTIVRTLPEARIIHMIRDGRDVMVSHRNLWFGPGDDPRAAASTWAFRIGRTRQFARFLPYYLEVRYEDLVKRPEQTLKIVMAYLDLKFEPAQIRAFERAEERLEELGDLKFAGRLISATQRQSIHALTKRPPDAGRIGRWRAEMAPADARAFERVAGYLLSDLGYGQSVY
ncbi:MAG: sulfotransferase [Parvularculaceae bacterium]|nr:sulfotransferase [Parvularculaceae bacterium]